MPVIPKPHHMRQHRIKTSTKATLEVSASLRRPLLPKRDDGESWHPLARRFWKDLWDSEIIAECINIDISGMFILLDLTHRYWMKPSTSLASEIRMQRQCFGLTPIDRRRLQWETQKVEKAKPSKSETKQQDAKADPRPLYEVL